MGHYKTLVKSPEFEMNAKTTHQIPNPKMSKEFNTKFLKCPTTNRYYKNIQAIPSIRRIRDFKPFLRILIQLHGNYSIELSGNW